MKILISFSILFALLVTPFGFGSPMHCTDLAVAFHRPVIKTDRLQIRPLSLAMINSLVKIMSHPQVRDNFGFAHRIPEETVKAMQKELADGFQLGGNLEESLVRFNYGVFRDEKLIGVVTLRRDVDHNPAAPPGAFDFAIGRALLPEFWGQGLAPEIAIAVLDHIFATTAARSVVAFVYEWNSQSFKTWERLGFKPVAVEEDTKRIYVMHREEWAEKRSKGSKPSYLRFLLEKLRLRTIEK